MADIPNTLQLAVELDTSDAKKKSGELSKKLSDMLKALDKSSTSKSKFSDIIKNTDDLDKAISRLNKKLETLQNRQLENLATENSKAISRTKTQIDSVTKSLAGLKKIQDELVNKPLISKQAATTARIAEAASGQPIIKEELLKRPILKAPTEGLQRGSVSTLVADDTRLKSTEQGLQRVSEATRQARIAQTEYNERLETADARLEAYEASLDPATEKLYKLNNELAKARKKFKEAVATGDHEGIEKAKEEIASLTKQIQKQEKANKKSAGSWGKLMGRIKNISIYRAIRTGIKWITSGFQEGLNNLTQYSDSVNSTMSNLNGSLNQIKNTMGIAFAGVLQALEPVLTTLANSIVDIVNAFNVALAKMQGKDTFLKAKKNVDDYAKSLQKVQKFSFDAFEVLSGGGETSPLEMFEESSVSDNTNKITETFGKILNVLKEIGQVVTTIIKEAIDSGALDIILDIVGMIATVAGAIVRTILNIITGLQKIGALKPLLIGIASAFIAIKVAALGAAIANAAMWVMKHPIAGTIAVLAGISTLAGVAAGLNSLLSNTQNSIQGFADGGFTTANFIATNENGRREWVGRNAGATAVVNDTQMSDIMYQAVRKGSEEGMINAIYETGLLDARSQRLVIDSRNINDGAFARAIFPALKVESTRRGGNQL